MTIDDADDLLTPVRTIDITLIAHYTAARSNRSR
jgi:hypothetical protein